MKQIIKKILIRLGFNTLKLRAFLGDPVEFLRPKPKLLKAQTYYIAINSEPRVALCFSGQLRQVEKGYEYINKNILKVNENIDIFIHAWAPEGEFTTAGGIKIQGAPKTILTDVFNYYHPKKMLIEKQILFDEKNYNKRKSKKIIPRFSLSKNYSLKQSFNLLDEDYDFVMSLRFDLGIKNPVQFNKFDPKVITMSEKGFNFDGGIDVTHAIVGGKWAKLYSEFYDNIENYYNEGINFCDEYLMHRHLDANNIPYVRTSLLNNYELLRGK